MPNPRRARELESELQRRRTVETSSRRVPGLHHRLVNARNAGSHNEELTPCLRAGYRRTPPSTSSSIAPGIATSALRSRTRARDAPGAPHGSASLVFPRSREFKLSTTATATRAATNCSSSRERGRAFPARGEPGPRTAARILRLCGRRWPARVLYAERLGRGLRLAFRTTPRSNRGSDSAAVATVSHPRRHAPACVCGDKPLISKCLGRMHASRRTGSSPARPPSRYPLFPYSAEPQNAPLGNKNGESHDTRNLRHVTYQMQQRILPEARTARHHVWFAVVLGLGAVISGHFSVGTSGSAPRLCRLSSPRSSSHSCISGDLQPR